MSNKNEVVPPLVLVQTFTNKYPGVWDRIDLLREKTVAADGRCRKIDGAV